MGEEYIEEYEIEPLDYEAELLNFCNVLDQNKLKFQNKSQDETLLNSEIMDNLDKLSEAIAALDEATNQKENVKLKTSNEEKNLGDVLNAIKGIEKRKQTSEKNFLGISEAVEKKKSELHTKRSKIASSSDLFKEKQNVISSEMEKWKKTLGLELIRSTHGGLIFKFTNIHRDDPEKVCTCELAVENRVYRVDNCSPSIEGISEMVETLNSTNDFSGFVVVLRKKFASLLS